MTYGSNRVAGGTIEGGGGCCWFAWVWTSALMFMDGGRRKSESCELGGWDDCGMWLWDRWWG